MQYMALAPVQRAALLGTLEDMPHYLERELAGLSPELGRQQGPDGAFSPVEQVWHLADLEREGFGWRIDKLLFEREPQLPDFDGAAIAAARHYRARSLMEGLAAFREARQRNLDTLRAIASLDWGRSGQQAGVGRVSLCDMPSFMSQHDAAHRAEIAAWKTLLAP
jgi:DinB superfamily